MSKTKTLVLITQSLNSQHLDVLHEFPREIRMETTTRAAELAPEVLLLLVLQHGVFGVPPELLLAPGTLPVLGQLGHAVPVVILDGNSIDILDLVIFDHILGDF